MWNDKETDVDLLGHRRIAQTIVEIMREDELRPLTVGIHGSWGAGKTSILSLIETELGKEPDVLCITFNGWLYQSYEDTKSALMELVVHELMQKRTAGDKVLDLGKSLLRRINWLKTAKVVGGAALTAAVGLPAASLFGLSGLLSSAKGLLEPNDSSGGKNTTLTVETQEEPWLKEEEATVPAQIHAFRTELKELIKRSTVERLVVLVDDLDRCLPPSVIDILEAIKLFLFVEGTVFVIAADEDMIKYAVRRHFPDLTILHEDYPKYYLEKLIQIPIRVPSLNKLQTQNYIRFLLLQNHLANNKERLNEICEHFESARTTPYDNTELTYEFISEQLGVPDPELRTTLSIAEQLSSTLAKELRGNPRNIKRFLNTLFLRERVAKIYGLSNVVKTDVLAKLMLLERFHQEQYEKIVLEVIQSDEGHSETIQRLESQVIEKKKPEALPKSNTVKVEKGESTLDSVLRDWANLAPSLQNMDLRPYAFISRDSAMSFRSSDELPGVLKTLFEDLATGARMTFIKHEQALKGLDPAQAKLIFDQLKQLSLKERNWQSRPKPMEGLLFLVHQQPSLEVRLIELLTSVATKDMGVWMATAIDFVKSPEGVRAKNGYFNALLQEPESSPALKTIIKQLSK